VLAQRWYKSIGHWEYFMSQTLKLIAVLGVTAFLAACAGKHADDVVVIEQEPISQEPAFTGKYK
jgi:hypothetical protein